MMTELNNKTEHFEITEKEINLQEEQLLPLFEMEELEKRYEMGWAPNNGKIGGSYSQQKGYEVNAYLEWNQLF